ncbi:glutathione S-transferase family protein [Indioceanicola profundi]|uniref:glutathione S-transferase family protein n=1 Tax=Indioceanicola profundi TaxID=2220096 RepID=UPI0013C4794E|nr:glutathione S-transferase N-terminal domain-containing protein [Indioceanicola profundi]
MDDNATATKPSLFISRTSPYARKVLVVAHEKGMAHDLAIVEVDPWTSPAELLAANPLSRIPALALADGSALVESWVIADYLDHVGPGAKLLAQTGPVRLDALKLMGIAQGMIDAAYTAVLENRRPEAQRSADKLARHADVIRRAVAHLDQRFTWNTPDPVDPLGMGDIAVATALSYLDFRHADLGWRELGENLAAWYDVVRERPSFRHTDFG